MELSTNSGLQSCVNMWHGYFCGFVRLLRPAAVIVSSCLLSAGHAKAAQSKRGDRINRWWWFDGTESSCNATGACIDSTDLTRQFQVLQLRWLAAIIFYTPFHSLDSSSLMFYWWPSWKSPSPPFTWILHPSESSTCLKLTHFDLQTKTLMFIIII